MEGAGWGGAGMLGPLGRVSQRRMSVLREIILAALKKSLFPVQQVANIMATWAAAISFFVFLKCFL